MSTSVTNNDYTAIMNVAKRVDKYLNKPIATESEKNYCINSIAYLDHMLLSAARDVMADDDVSFIEDVMLRGVRKPWN